jgi:hypothetical protein
MNKAYVISFDSSLSPEILEDFFEAIRSSYVSKKGNKNLFIAFVPGESKAQEIYNTIASKMKNKMSFLVVQLQNFYGNLPNEVFAWLKETVPTINLIYEPGVPAIEKK